MEQIALDRLGGHNVVFGVYRDGDNNLDEVQERNVTDFIHTTAANRALKVVAEDTTRVPRGPFDGQLRTEWSTIEDGRQHITRITAPADMSSRPTLAAFVEQTLEARAKDPRFRSADVWIDLVDHGGGDGGGLQADSSGGFMPLEDIAGAITDGRAAFRKHFPDADDSITGVLANQCLMATIGFCDTLSHSGIRYLAASPETMLAPGVPSAQFADTLTHGGPHWAQAAVDVTMHARYGTGSDAYHPAAAFDVLDLDSARISNVRSAVANFNHQVSSLPHSDSSRQIAHEIRSDLRSVRGMVRFDHTADMPWHADRPAIAAYDAVADDERLPDALRGAAKAAAVAVAGLVLAHKESADFGPFHASYADAVGPTAHLPITRQSYDAWAGNGVVETHNDFYDAVDGRDFARAIGAYDAHEDAAGAVA